MVISQGPYNNDLRKFTEESDNVLHTLAGLPKRRNFHDILRDRFTFKNTMFY